MQGLILFALGFVIACWVLVVGHQMGWSTFDPDTYEFLNAALAIAYLVAGLSICTVVAATVVSLVKKE